MQGQTKYSEENIGRMLLAINHSMIFFDPPPRLMKIKTKINTWKLIKLKIPKTNNQKK